MNARRIDELLQEALASGVVPPGVSASERAELEALLSAAGSARAARASVDAESLASLPTARTRFQRYVEAQTAAAQLPAARPVPRRGFWGRILVANRALAVGASAAAIGILALLAVVASQSLGGVDTASAQVLSENDYAQLQGVITATSGEGPGRTATLLSHFGEIQVALGDLATVTNAGQPADPSTLKVGDSVTLAGTVLKEDTTTRIAARTLAVVKANAKLPEKRRLMQLREIHKALEGRITVLAVAKGGKSARVLVDAGNGEQFVVAINAKTLGELLKAGEAAVGRRVVVSQEAGSPRGQFSLTPAPLSAQAGQPVRPNLPAVAGIVLARDANLLRIQTERGPVNVVLTVDTRIVIGPGVQITGDHFRGGTAAAGHAVIIQGGVDRATGRIVADVIWVGPKPAR